MWKDDSVRLCADRKISFTVGNKNKKYKYELKAGITPRSLQGVLKSHPCFLQGC